MANVQHKNLADAELHEPKGAAGASVDTSYISNGAGSGTWKANPYTYTVTRLIPDIGTAGSYWVNAGPAGKITKVACVIDGAITGVNSTLSLKLATVAVTNSTVTITQAASAAGTTGTATPSAANTVTANQAIEIVNAGESTGPILAMVTITIAVGYT